ncbi:unnamed protein product [Cuscuta epithymum]|uniref:Uncharacterized protein n=1 Tax=Cuscuta epithymum TaxID=186058 RepID=A0AAV0DW75_9ASTE|nr:unnamed protein product [Cuscuta epithymum]
MDSVVDWYKQMAIGDDEEELNLDEGEVESSPVEEAAIGFPVIGQVLIDCKVKFPDLKKTMLSLWRPGKDNFCPLNYEEGLVLEKRFGPQLRAGSGVNTSPIGGHSWLLEGSSSSNRTGGGPGESKAEGKIVEKEKVSMTESAQSFTQGAMVTSSPSLSPPLVGRSQRKKFLRGGRYGRLKQRRSKWRTPWLWTEQKTGRRQALLHKPVEDVGCRMEVTRQRDSSGVMPVSGVFFILLCLLLQ